MVAPEGNWEAVTVPHTYSLDALDGVGYFKGVSWYRTTFEPPANMLGERIFIRFEGVGQEAEVFINERRVGGHVGAYSAFAFEITDYLKHRTQNVIAVRTTNEPNFKRIPVNDKLFNHYGGINRPVQLFSTPAVAISPVHYASSGLFVEVKSITKDQALLEVRTHILSDEIVDVALEYTLKDAEGKQVLNETQSAKITEDGEVITASLKLNNPTLWHGRQNSYLYSIEVKLKNGDTEDVVEQAFGVRTYGFDPDEGFSLNGKPYRLYGVAMHQEWKSTGPALTGTQHRKNMELIDEIGATCLRTSHYQHSDLVYQLADEIGIVTWAEIPFVHNYSGREGDNAKQQLKEMIFQNYNHPSIIVWGLWNEVRANNSPTEACVPLTMELNQMAHKLDGTRPTISASDKGMESNMGNISDLQAWNKYFGWYYGDYEDLGTWLDESHAAYPNRPLAISEYGIGGNISHQDQSLLEKPRGNYFPEMEQTEYHELSWKILKDRPYVWGSFIWNMFDFSVADWNRGGIRSLNHKGLVTFDRKVKKDAFYFYKANWSDEPVLYIAERRFTERKFSTATVKVFSNQENVQLLINGKSVESKKNTSDLNIIKFENVKMRKGKNTMKVISDQKLVDEVEWTVNK